MPDPKGDAVSNFPPYLGGGRKAAFLLLAFVAILETAAQIWTGFALTSIIGSPAAAAWLVANLVAAFSVLACLFWARGVTAEWLGQDYVNDVRSGLARQAVRSALGRGRLGTITARMSADLTALKNWSDAGVCGAISGLLTLAAGLVSALINVGVDGLLSCLVGPAVSLLFVLVFWLPLRSRVRQRRAVRGLLSARTGDAIFAARTAAVYAAFESFVRPIARSGKRLVDISVKTISIVQLLRASSTVTFPGGIVLFAFMGESGRDVSASAWGGLIYSLGLCASGVALLVLSVEALIERRIALQKLKDLDTQAHEAPALAPQGSIRIPRKPVLPLSVDGRVLANPGDVLHVPRSSFPGLSMRLLRGDEGILLGDLPSSQTDPRDWARRVALVTESVPLPRGAIRAVVKSRRRPTRRQVKAAMDLAGINPDDPGLPSIIDPQRHMIEPAVLSRLRLVRGLVAGPHALIIDEPWLAADVDLKQRLAEWARESGRCVVWLEVV